MEASATPPSAATYPVRLDAERQDRYQRFLPLVKWFLAIPHYFVLVFLFLGVLFAHLIAFFAVIFTRSFPRGLFDYIVGVYRWSWRVQAYVQLLRDQYPPFSLADDPAYPAHLDIGYPEAGIDRWRPLVQWLLAIPYLIVVGVLGLFARAATILGLFVILFTEHLPEIFFRFIVVPQRWGLRGITYAGFMIDRYPPFDFDELGQSTDDAAPGAAVAPPEPPAPPVPPEPPTPPAP
jgi:uncharacterized protein DUF4389